MSAAVVAGVFLLIVSPAARATTQVHYVMGTFLRVTVDDVAESGVFAECFTRARVLDRTFSRFDAGSELERLNAGGGGPASPLLRTTLARAMVLRRATGGTFDVSAGAVTTLWRAPVIPSVEDAAAARATVGAVGVDGERVVLGHGTRLDFDGFAKGVAVDACVDALRGTGVTRALVSFGESSLYAMGAPRGASAWELDVRGPDPDVVVARLRLRDRGAAVSAAFGGAGRRTGSPRAHIVDPRSGRPLSLDAASVVVASSASEAEAFAKTVLVLGGNGVSAAERRRGLLAARVRRDGIEIGKAMRAAGALRVLARPRRVEGEVALR